MVVEYKSKYLSKIGQIKETGEDVYINQWGIYFVEKDHLYLVEFPTILSPFEREMTPLEMFQEWGNVFDLEHQIYFDNLNELIKFYNIE